MSSEMQVPDGWETVVMNDITTVMTNGFVGSAVQHYSTEGIPYLMSKNVRDNLIDERGLTYISEDFHKGNKRSVLQENDLLTVQSGHIGTSATVPLKYHGANAHALIISRVKYDICDSNFVAYYFNSEVGRRRLSSIFVGSTIKHINTKDLKKFSLPLPPLQEQQKIASILTSVDDVIEKTESQISKLQDLKKGMMTELLTKGIGHTEFKDSPVGLIPAEWEVVTLGSVAIPKGLQTGPFGSQLHAHEYVDFGIPVVMPKDMKDNDVILSDIAYISEKKALSLEKHRVKSGDILFARRGEIGRCVLITNRSEGWLCGTGCLRARIGKKVFPEFLKAYLSLPTIIDWLNNNAVGQTMLNLNTSILASMPLVLPSLNEQKTIALSINAVSVSIKKKQLRRDHLQALKKALMNDLLTGKVRVSTTN